MANHLITSQVLDIKFLSATQDVAVLAWLQNWVEAELLPALNKTFDQQDNQHLLHLDRVEIDIGSVPFHNWQQLLTDRIVAQLESQLMAVSLPHLANKAQPTDNEPDEINAFVFFLQTGTLPWYLNSTTLGSLNQWVAKLYQQHPEALKNRLTQQFAIPTTIRRFVYQFSPQQRQQVGQLFEAQDPAFYPFWQQLFTWQRQLSVTLQETVEVLLWQALTQPVTPTKSILLQQLVALLRQETPSKQQKTSIHSLRQLVIEASWVSLAEWQGIEKTYSQNTKNQKDTPTIITKLEKTIEQIFVTQAGLCLLRPFLKQYLESLMGADTDWSALPQRARAVQLLHYVSTGKTKCPEYDLTFCKVLCDLPLEYPVSSRLNVTPMIRAETEGLLQTVIHYWGALKGTSIANLRSSFLQREGSLHLQGNPITLYVEYKTYDILLEQLPWGFHTSSTLFENRFLEITW
ncbi:MAG: contractile injection system tape measure protein [Spirosomataceae bacterium]